MPSFEIRTAFVDGWHCDRHFIEAASVEDAVQIAYENAGMGDESWTVVEPGETIIDEIVQIVDGERVPVDFDLDKIVDNPLESLVEKQRKIILTLLSEFSVFMSVQRINEVNSFLDSSDKELISAIAKRS